jgi:hypothetical protein
MDGPDSLPDDAPSVLFVCQSDPTPLDGWIADTHPKSGVLTEIDFLRRVDTRDFGIGAWPLPGRLGNANARDSVGFGARPRENFAPGDVGIEWGERSVERTLWL